MADPCVQGRLDMLACPATLFVIYLGHVSSQDYLRDFVNFVVTRMANQDRHSLKITRHNLLKCIPKRRGVFPTYKIIISDTLSTCAYPVFYQLK